MVSYFSTRGHKDSLSFEDVILSGVAPDKGLYLPDYITLENLTYLTQEDLSYEDFVKTIFTASIAAEPVSPLVATITKPLSPNSVNLLSAIAPSGCKA